MSKYTCEIGSYYNYKNAVEMDSVVDHFPRNIGAHEIKNVVLYGKN